MGAVGAAGGKGVLGFLLFGTGWQASLRQAGALHVLRGTLPLTVSGAAAGFVVVA